MAQTLISQLPTWQAHHDKLRALGYTTAGQLLGVAKAAGPALASYLGIAEPALNTLLAGMQAVQSLPAAAQQPLRKFRTGVALSRIPLRAMAFAAPAPQLTPLPATVNLIAEMPAIRDQKNRGTCVAHASTTVADHYFRNRQVAGGPLIVDLAPQFLYWDCKQKDGNPTEEGTTITLAMQLLQGDGCCLEATWPYVPDEIPGNESQDPPPPAAIAEAPSYTAPTYKQLSPTSVLDIKAELAGGRCVAFSIPAFPSWTTNNAYVDQTGEIGNPLHDETTDDGHAMCFVGYQDEPGATEIGEGRFYLRNSWGPSWAYASTLGTAGYGTIPYSYISRYGREAFSIG